MNDRLVYTSCSEVIVDTCIHDPGVALQALKQIMDALNLNSSPPITEDLLRQIKDIKASLYVPEVVLYNDEGHFAFVSYGTDPNLEAGYSLDTNSSVDQVGRGAVYPILADAVDAYEKFRVLGRKVDFESWRELEDERKWLRLLSISLSDSCIGTCSFCYKNSGSTSPKKKRPFLYDILDSVYDLFSKKWVYGIHTICMEYSGYNVWFIPELVYAITEKIHSTENYNKVPRFTVTTMPAAVDTALPGFLKAAGIHAVALSFDEEKCTVDQWTAAARLFLQEGIIVSCNFLLTKNNTLPIPNEIMSTAYQINLLSMKPTGMVDNETKGYISENYLFGRQKYPVVAVDNCLAVQLGLRNECRPGEDFIHISADGSILPCCFKEKCYLWDQDKENRTRFLEEENC